MTQCEWKVEDRDFIHWDMRSREAVPYFRKCKNEARNIIIVKRKTNSRRYKVCNFHSSFLLKRYPEQILKEETP
jgi:hypothetical protein